MVYNRLMKATEIEALSVKNFYQLEGTLGVRAADLRIGCNNCTKPEARM